MTSIIDGDYLLHVIPHKMDGVSNNFDDFKREIDKHLEYIMQETQATHYLIFLSEGKNFRHRVAQTKTYKGTRRSRKPFMFADLKNYLIDDYQAIIVNDMEADDMVLIYHKLLEHDNPGDNIIVTPDKDLYQVPGKFYNPQKDVFKDLFAEEARYNFWYSMLVGDSTDNIPGAYNIGKKKAASILDRTDSENYRGVVLDIYIQQHGIKKGINQFAECFNLLYILRDAEEFECECQPIPLPLKEPEYKI
jgi:5'-3' exonuclease